VASLGLKLLPRLLPGQHQHRRFCVKGVAVQTEECTLNIFCCVWCDGRDVYTSTCQKSIKKLLLSMHIIENCQCFGLLFGFCLIC
jgi:hypothetical protein